MDAQSYSRLAPRWVGSAMRNCPPGLPWHRVLNSQGKISLPFEHGGSLQRQLLEAEGIVFDLHDRIDLNEFGWEGPVK
jgi:methylated-DNA-protein-cysteine methyltransferase-like protein